MTRERPILFSGPMVRAILEGRKTQTRRVVKPQPHDNFYPIDVGEYHPERVGRDGEFCPALKTFGAYDDQSDYPAPFHPGDLLWVRESFYRFGHWEPVPGVRTKGNRQKWRFVADSDETRFDAPVEYRKGRHHKDPSTPAWHKRLGRFMPRALSRITLEATGVRVERLQDISEADAKAEGIERCGGNMLRWQRFPDFADDDSYCTSARDSFRTLWESINGADSWDANPWVWVIEFKRV